MSLSSNDHWPKKKSGLKQQTHTVALLSLSMRVRVCLCLDFVHRIEGGWVGGDSTNQAGEEETALWACSSAERLEGLIS